MNDGVDGPVGALFLRISHMFRDENVGPGVASEVLVNLLAYLGGQILPSEEVESFAEGVAREIKHKASAYIAHRDGHAG